MLSVVRATAYANLTTIVLVLAGALVLHEPLTVGGAIPLYWWGYMGCRGEKSARIA